jgi:MATE family multidrug resistance protein
VFDSEAKKLLSNGAGVSVTVAASVGISFIETLVVSALGPDQLAGVTVALSIYGIIFAGSMGMAVAITPILAQAVGKKDDPAVRAIAHQGVLVLAVVSLVSVAMLALSLVTLRYVTSSPDEFAFGFTYLVCTSFGLPAWIFYFGLRSILVAVNRVKIASYAMLASVPVHAVLAYFLTNGTFLTPPMGVAGAGIAYSLTSCVTVGAIVVAMARSNAPALVNIMTGPLRVRRPEFLAIARLGIPTAARIVLKEGMLPASVLLVAPLGTKSIVAHAIALRMVSITGIASFGISIATIAQVGEAVGGNAWMRARQISSTAIKLSITIGAALCVAIIVAASPISQLFISSTDAELLALSTRLLGIVCLFILINSLQAPVIGALVAVQDAKLPLLFSAGGNWLVGFPLAYILSRTLHYGIEGAWVGLIIGSIVATGLLIVRLRSNLLAMPATVIG